MMCGLRFHQKVACLYKLAIIIDREAKFYNLKEKELVQLGGGALQATTPSSWLHTLLLVVFVVLEMFSYQKKNPWYAWCTIILDNTSNNKT